MQRLLQPTSGQIFHDKEQKSQDKDSHFQKCASILAVVLSLCWLLCQPWSMAHTHTLVCSMESEWATVFHQLLRFLNFLELSEHIELCQCSQARNDRLNEKYCWCVLSVLSATDSRQHFSLYAERLGLHMWWIKKTLASFAVQDHHYPFSEPVLKGLTFTSWSPVPPFLQYFRKSYKPSSLSATPTVITKST